MKKFLPFLIILLPVIAFAQQQYPVYHHLYEIHITTITETRVIEIPADKYIGIVVQVNTVTNEVSLTGVDTATLTDINGGIKAKSKKPIVIVK